ncbi:MAG: DMT family transporter [Limnohabitans sp.]|nr:MAG: DMT family transporter [Limnohabitans sp.]
MSSTQATRLSAILTMVAAMACLSTQDTLSKQLMLSLAPAIIIWTRYGLQTALVSVSLLRRRSPALWRTRQWRLQLLRGMLVVGGSVCGYGALQRMPVAEFTAIYCLVPLAVTLVARFVMKEQVSWLGWLCVAGGLTGALLVVRPGGDVDPAGALLALAGVVCYTGFQTLTGYLARQDSPLTIQLCTSVFGFASLSLAVPFFWPAALPWPDLALLLMVALAGAYGQYFMVLVFAKAPASVLSPYLYSAIGFSALGGWWMFGHLPDATAICGMLMIAGFGLAAGWLNQRKASA